MKTREFASFHGNAATRTGAFVLKNSIFSTFIPSHECALMFAHLSFQNVDVEIPATSSSMHGSEGKSGHSITRQSSSGIFQRCATGMVSFRPSPCPNVPPGCSCHVLSCFMACNSVSSFPFWWRGRFLQCSHPAAC
jgi:hypothetical protein